MKNHTLSTLLAIAILSIGCQCAQGRTFRVVKKTCPLCDLTFKTTVDTSGTQFDMRLDLKPLGPTPAPWRVPVCPRCHFVFYCSKIPDNELVRCRKLVASEEYKRHAGRASYFLQGILYEGLKKDDLAIAHVFLKASWQEESEANNYREDLGKSLQHFEEYLANVKEHDESWQRLKSLPVSCCVGLPVLKPLTNTSAESQSCLSFREIS